MRNPVFAFIFERLAARNEQRGQARLRKELLAGLTGRVLELGPGTGLNFQHYPPTVDVVIAVEPEVRLRHKAAVAASHAPVTVRVVSGMAERIPCVDNAFDAVVMSGVLCSVSDVTKALAEVGRVLRPGRELRFYEHVRSDSAGRGRYQDVVNLVWRRFMGGMPPEPPVVGCDRGRRISGGALPLVHVSTDGMDLASRAADSRGRSTRTISDPAAAGRRRRPRARLPAQSGCC